MARRFDVARHSFDARKRSVRRVRENLWFEFEREDAEATGVPRTIDEDASASADVAPDRLFTCPLANYWVNLGRCIESDGLRACDRRTTRADLANRDVRDELSIVRDQRRSESRDSDSHAKNGSGRTRADGISVGRAVAASGLRARGVRLGDSRSLRRVESMDTRSFGVPAP